MFGLAMTGFTLTVTLAGLGVLTSGQASGALATIAALSLGAALRLVTDRLP